MKISKKKLSMLIENYLLEDDKTGDIAAISSDASTAKFSDVFKMPDQFQKMYDSFTEDEDISNPKDDIVNNPAMVLAFRKWFKTKLNKKQQREFFRKHGLNATTLSTSGKYAKKYNKYVKKAFEFYGDEYIQELNPSLYNRLKKSGQEYLDKASKGLENVQADRSGKKLEGRGAAIYISFSDVKPISKMAKGTNPTIQKIIDRIPQGHAGVILIEPDGKGHYFDFGRYGSGKNCKKKEGKFGLGAIGVTGNVRYASLGRVKYKDEADLSAQVKRLVSRANSKIGLLRGKMVHTTKINLNGAGEAVSKGLEVLKSSGNCHSYSVTRALGGAHGKSEEGSYQFNCGTFSTYLFGIAKAGTASGGGQYIKKVGGLGAPDSIVAGIAEDIGKQTVAV
jgi:hypothetical protein